MARAPSRADDIIGQLPELDIVELRRVRDAVAEQEALKFVERKKAIFAQLAEDAAVLGISVRDLLAEASPVEKAEPKPARARPAVSAGGKVAAKYRSPEGTEWSGRGKTPAWLSGMEDDGHKREEFLIKEEQPDLMG